MDKLKIFCITNKERPYLEKLDLDLVGVGKENFSKKYIQCLEGDNIQHKEQYYSELTFHYWFWKNQLKTYDENIWIGFCQKRRFWIKEKKKLDNFEDLKENLLTSAPISWNNCEAILCEPINISGIKNMKLLKRGWRNIIEDPYVLIDKNKRNIKLHFDIHHGYKNLQRAIEVMNRNDRDDFKDFVSTKNLFNPHIMFIAKPKIINKWFESLFSWLFECEKVLGFDKLKGYDETRLYAYLAERYLSFWFKKYTKSLDWPWGFFEDN